MSLEWNIRCNWCKCVIDPKKQKFFYTIVFTEYDIDKNKDQGRSSALGLFRGPILGEKVALCVKCPKRHICNEPCGKLTLDLEKQEGPPFWGPLLSEMLIERVFPEMPKETPQQQAARLKKERKRQGKAINQLIGYFSALSREKGKSLKYYFVWKLAKEDKLKQHEIAEILSISRVRVNQILKLIQGKP